MSTSVKTRKMTSNKGADGRKGASQKSSPKMTKYLLNLGTTKTPDLETDKRQSTMPTPTRSTHNKDKQRDQVCETLYRNDSDSEYEVNSVNSDTLNEQEPENDFKLPYTNIGELENECPSDIDPREVTLTLEAVPVIMLSLLRKIEGVQVNVEDLQKENDNLKISINQTEKSCIDQENEMKHMSIEMIKLKETLNDSEKDNNNLKTSLDFAYIQIANLESKEKERTESEKKVKKNMDIIRGENSKLKEDTKKNKDKTIKAETYSRRSNLRFEGIPSSPNETNVQSRNKVYEFLKTNLGINDAEKNIVIERCHRDQKYPNQEPASIIVRFLDFNDREKVWGQRNMVNKDRDNKFYINEDFPQEVERKRSFLRPYVKAAYANNMKATLLVDTLLVEGEKYTVDNLHTLPEKIRPEKTVVKTDGETTVFFRKDAFMSNFHPSPMNIDNEKFSCVEQFYMAAKAEKFDDTLSRQQIMASTNPNEINFLGKNVKNFKQNVWNETAYDVMKVAVKAKFAQNPRLAKLLKNTGKTIIGEGSGKDTIWGTGIPVFHRDALDTSKWKGRNQLGKLLMEVRGAL